MRKPLYTNYNFNKVKVGQVLLNVKNNKLYVCIDTNMNGDDEYYSHITVVEKEEFDKYHAVLKNNLKTIEEIYNYFNSADYELVNEKCKIEKETMFYFGG